MLLFSRCATCAPEELGPALSGSLRNALEPRCRPVPARRRGTGGSDIARLADTHRRPRKRGPDSIIDTVPKKAVLAKSRRSSAKRCHATYCRRHITEASSAPEPASPRPSPVDGLRFFRASAVGLEADMSETRSLFSV